MYARRTPLKSSVVITIAAVCWIGVVSVGLSVVYRHEATPAPQVQVAAQWPVESSVPHPGGTPALIMFAHPNCPCTRASVQELSRIAAQSRGRAAITVVFLAMEDQKDALSGTPLWQQVVAIPGVRAVADNDGREAGLFGPLTSGHTLLYDKNGELVFEGGITASRGHEGDNIGRTSVVTYLLNEAPEARQTPVYGCALVADFPAAKEGKSCCN